MLASHASAARLHRLPIPTIPDEHVTVLDRKHRRSRPGIVCHLLRMLLVLAGLPEPVIAHEAIDDDGWRIVLVTCTGVYDTSGDTLAKVHRLLRERGASSVPRTLPDHWRAHFPDRSAA